MPASVLDPRGVMFCRGGWGQKQRAQHKTQSHSASEQSPRGNIQHLGLMICNFSAIFPDLSGQLAALAEYSITRKLYDIVHFSNKWHSSCLANQTT